MVLIVLLIVRGLQLAYCENWTFVGNLNRLYSWKMLMIL